MQNNASDFIVYSFIVAGIFVMTKNANGANMLKALTGGYASIVQAATGQAVTAR